MLKLTTDNQTDKQTNRQDKNNMQPIIRSGGIKTTDELMFATPAIYIFINDILCILVKCQTHGIGYFLADCIQSILRM